MYATIEADIIKGKFLPLEPDRMPESGHALLVILSEPKVRTAWKKVRKQLGCLKATVDPATWQNQEREECAGGEES